MPSEIHRDTRLILSLLDQEGACPWEERIKKQYIPSIFSNALISKDSAHGQISNFINRIIKIIDYKAGYTKIFQKALRDVPREYLQNLDEKRLRNFYQLHQAYTPRPPQEVLQQLLQRIEQGQIGPTPTTHWTRDPNALRALSLFRTASDQPKEGINGKILDDLCNLSSERLDRDTLTYIMNHLGDRGAALRSALAAGDDLEQELQALKDVSELTTLSKKVSDELRVMPRAARRLFFGGSLQREAKINIPLPKAPENELQRGILHFVEKGEIREVFDRAYQLIAEETKAALAQMFPKGGAKAGLKSLFENKLLEHACPALLRPLGADKGAPWYSKLLWAPAEVVRSYAANKAQEYYQSWAKSLEEQLAQMLSPSQAAEIKKALCSDEAEKAIKKLCEQTILEPIRAFRSNALNRLSEKIAELPPLIPNVLKWAGMGDLGSPEQSIWFEVEKQPDDKFTLAVYASGELVKLHPSLGEKHAVPIYYRNLTLEQLDPEFFYTLLGCRAIPKWDNTISYSPADIYGGLLQTIEKNKVDASRFVEKTKGISTTGENFIHYLSNNLGLKDKASTLKFFYDLKKQALVDLCLAYQS